MEEGKMTKTQFMKKVRELARETKKDIIDECWRLLNSGAIDYQKYENGYALPKTVMTVACEKAAWNWHPLSSDLKAEARNLRKF
ncbi:hypothetical protein LCGC14_0396550 [marine sediment metagenome]|uniref:Uncharacterized protein n=1 Tax=marine sediment metagenome TaxID=412755 RepID=A0A0F9W756_9ZZZZ